jgi:hypothetical protein
MDPPCTEHLAQILKNLLSVALSTAPRNSPCSLLVATRFWAGPQCSLKLKRVIHRADSLSFCLLLSSTDQLISVPSESSVYPDFKALHWPAPNDRLASKKNHIEQKFNILKRNGTNRSEDCECQCALCSISLQKFKSTHIRVHLTGESQGAVRVAP